MSRMASLKNGMRRLSNYWWVGQVVWLIAFIGGILWLIWTAPSENSRFFYAGGLGSVVNILLGAILIVGLPFSILLMFLKFRQLGSLLGMSLAHAIVIIVVLALMGPIIGKFFDFGVTEVDRVKLGDELYILSHDRFDVVQDDGQTFYLHRCEGLFKKCQDLYHFQSYEFLSGSGIPEIHLSIADEAVSIVADDDNIYTHQP